MQQDQKTATKCSETLSKCCKLDLKEQANPSNCYKRQGFKKYKKTMKINKKKENYQYTNTNTNTKTTRK